MRNVFFFSTLFLFALAAGTTFSQTIFTSSGTFIVPPGVDSITVEMVGAGGSGGNNGAGGGGGGGYAIGTFSVVPLTSHIVTIGAGGSGTATTFSGLPITATAGANGGIVPNPNLGGGGAGGVGSGGTVNRTGGTGGGGYWTYFGGGGGGAAGATSIGYPGGNTIVYNGTNCLTPGGAGGVGGGAPGGAGGKGAGFTNNTCTVTDPAGNGASYGGGGGGGNGIGSGPGVGSGGYCSITWNVSTGTSTVFQKETISVFPNYFTNKINVQHATGNENFELLNCMGQTLWTGKHIEQKDFSWLAAGFYFLKTDAEHLVKTFKVVKE